MPRTYLDHAASTPLRPEAVEAVAAELTRVGNPSSGHGSGRAARRVVEDARELVAARLGAEPYEVIFTSGGTESDNLAVKGAFFASERSEIVVSATEHHAVLDAAAWLEAAQGGHARVARVDTDGRVDLDVLEGLVSARTAVVSVHWANNEVGTVQPVARVAEIARRHGALAHSDAVQAPGILPVDFAASGLDLLTVSAHKLGGPVGVGALVARREVRLTPVLHGGGQERDLRSGTVAVAAVAGFAAALDAAAGSRDAETVRLAALRDRLVAGVRAVVPDVVLTTPAGPGAALPGLAHLAFPGCESADLLLLLDAAGIDCSAGSACSAGVTEPSHVLRAMGRTDTEARSALRVSLGHTSTAADVDALLAVLGEAVARARRAGALTG